MRNINIAVIVTTTTTAAAVIIIIIIITKSLETALAQGLKILSPGTAHKLQINKYLESPLPLPYAMEVPRISKSVVKICHNVLL